MKKTVPIAGGAGFTGARTANELSVQRYSLRAPGEFKAATVWSPKVNGRQGVERQAPDVYLSNFDKFSDVREQSPAPLVQLELAGERKS